MSISAVQSNSIKPVESQVTRQKPVEKAEKAEPVRSAIKSDDAPKPRVEAKEEEVEAPKPESKDSKIDVKA